MPTNYFDERLPPGETIRPFTVTPAHLGFDEYDVAVQGLVSHHYWMLDGEFEARSAPFRYVWPSELDLMARLAGMTLASAGATGPVRRSPATVPSTSRCGSGLSVGKARLGGQGSPA